jgi:hypothetical protein
MKYAVSGLMHEQKLLRLTRANDDRLAMGNVTADLVTSKEQQTIFIREFCEYIGCSSEIEGRQKTRSGQASGAISQDGLAGASILEVTASDQISYC